MTDERGALTQGRAKQLLADLGLLLSANLHPELGDVGAGLHGRELTEVGVIVTGGNLDEEDKGLGLSVEFLLQDAGRFLDITLGGWK